MDRSQKYRNDADKKKKKEEKSLVKRWSNNLRKALEGEHRQKALDKALGKN